MIHRRRREANSAMDVNLLFVRNPARRPEMQQMAGSIALREITSVLYEHVGEFGEVVIEKEG
jgi:hypothetical protein